MIIRLLDTETTGVDENDMIVQLAWVDCILVNNKFIPIESQEHIVFQDVKIKEGVPHKITDEIVCNYGKTWQEIITLWNKNINPFEDFVFIAHNASFDVKMLKKIGIDLENEKVLDTYKQFPWKNATKLSYICADFGILVCDAHQALIDVMAMISLMNKQDILSNETFISYAYKTPIIFVSILPFEKKDEAKERGYSWNDEFKIYEKKVYEDSYIHLEWEKKLINEKPVNLISLLPFDKKEQAKEKGYKWNCASKSWEKFNFRLYEGYEIEKWEKKI